MHTLEVYHWLTCRPKLCVLWILSVEWKDSLHLCVSAFFYKGFSLNGYVSLKFFLIKMQHPTVTNPVLSVSALCRFSALWDSAYLYRQGRTVKSVSFPLVHNRHSPCEHSLRRLFTITPIGCEHLTRHLFTRTAAVVHKWWRGPVFGVCGEMMKMYKYTIAAYLCKTEALRMRYLGRRFCLDENKRFLE